MLTELQIGCLLIDTNTEQPVLMLQDLDGQRAIPIVIGLTEAGAIASELERVRFPRPMTHDLLRSVVARLGARVERIVITDLRDDTFFARVMLRHGDDDTLIDIDSRPSDAIALAVRCNAPIYAADHVLDQAGVNTTGDGESQDEASAPRATGSQGAEAACNDADVVVLPPTHDTEAMRDFLEQLSPEDFGKYKQ